MLAPTVKAASTPTLTLSTSSGHSAVGDNVYGNVASATAVTVTGTGFAGGQDNINVGYITLNSAVSATNFVTLTLVRASLTSASTPVGQVRADANGWFTAIFYVPELQSGSYQIVAEYTPSSGSQTLTSGTPFTVNTYAAVIDYASGSTSGEIFGAKVSLVVSGFQSGDVLSLAPSTLFTTSDFGLTAAYTSVVLGTSGSTCDSASTTTGSCSAAAENANGQAYVASHKGGTFAVTVTGGTSSLTASTTFTLLPSVAFLTASGVTTLSIPSTGGALKIEGFGFSATTSTGNPSTIPTNSLTLTVGSVTTTAIMVSVTTDNLGHFAPTSFTVTQTLPTGLVTAVLNGTTFSWTNANIMPPDYAGCGNACLGGVLLTENDGYNVPLISSNSAGPAYLLTDSTSYTARYSYPYVFGINFPASQTTFTSQQYTPTNGVAATWALDGGSSFAAGCSGCTSTNVGTDSNGAFYTGSDATVPSSYGTNNIITVTYGTTTGTAALTTNPTARFSQSTSSHCPNCFSGSSGSGKLTTSGSGGLTPFYSSTSTSVYALEVTGFKESTSTGVDSTFTATLTSSTGAVTTWATIPKDTTACAADATPPTIASPTSGTGDMCVFATGQYVFNLGPAPDLAGGVYTLTIAGSTSGNTATQTVTVRPNVVGTALSVTSGTPGNTIAFQTTQISVTSGTTAGSGVHGLAPSTAFSVMFDGPSGTSIGTFTSTTAGQIPPGTQFALPAGASGLHVVDIVATGSTTSAIAGSIVQRAAGSGQYSGYAVSASPSATGSDSLLLGTPTAATQGLTILLSGSATLSPNVGTAGTVTTVSASGLTPNKVYYVVLANDVAYASFTSTATGTIPAGTTFTFPNYPVATAGDEQGEAQTVYISSNALHTSGVGATAVFILQSSLTMSASTASAGSTLTVSAKALVNAQTYNIIFNYALNSQGTAFTGTTVGSIVGGTDGTASGQFTVPANSAAGTYTIQLVRAGCGTATTCAALVSAPTLTIGGPSGIGTSTLAPSGSATESPVNGQATVSQSFTNTASGSLSVYMWVSVTNSAGQTVGVFLGSSTIGAGATATIGAALFNLPSGSYTATVFVTTTTGIVVSSTSTTSSFTV